MTVFVNGALEQAVLYAEECMAKGESKQVLDMIGGGVAETGGKGERKAARLQCFA